MENNKEEFEWVSVSSAARFLGCSKQSVYNMLKDGLYEKKTFERGSMKGILLKFPKAQMVNND